MRLTERITSMPTLQHGLTRSTTTEEAPSLRATPFTLLEAPSVLSREECDHLAFCERHDFKAHEKEVAACIAEFRKLRKAGDLMARAQIERARCILEHLAELH